MKQICLAIFSVIAMANATANNVVSTGEVSSSAEPKANCLSFEDNLLSFCKQSKLVISDANGCVVFYNENVQTLDFSAWEHGSYIAHINDKETFMFTL